jgi:single-strand DNA-binding protein
MPNSATIHIIGHLGPRIELNHLPGKGTPVLKFSVCVNTGYTDKKQATWYNCAFFGDRAAKVHPMLAKGQAIGIVGEPSLREYSTNSGKRQSLDVRVADIILLGGRDHAAPATEAAPATDEQEIPF